MTDSLIVTLAKFLRDEMARDRKLSTWESLSPGAKRLLMDLAVRVLEVIASNGPPSDGDLLGRIIEAQEEVSALGRKPTPEETDAMSIALLRRTDAAGYARARAELELERLEPLREGNQ